MVDLRAAEQRGVDAHAGRPKTKQERVVASCAEAVRVPGEQDRSVRRDGDALAGVAASAAPGTVPVEGSVGREPDDQRLHVDGPAGRRGVDRTGDLDRDVDPN